MYQKIINANTLLFAMAAYFVWQVSKVQYWNWASWLIFAVLLLDCAKDRKDGSWREFLPTGVFLLGSFYFIYRYAPSFWYWVSSWELHSVSHILNWNHLFKEIPFNDGAIFRVFHPWPLTEYMRFVYSNGFTIPLWYAIIRSFLTRDAKKMVRYALSGHVIQLPIIIPFYMTILLQEVWYVLGDPDGMARHFTPEQAALWSQNCFPSMHTSVSFAILLVALREKGKLFKWITVTYCASVIYSTLYLEIHWVIDVIGGLLLGYGAVKLADYVIRKFEEKKQISAHSTTLVPAPPLQEKSVVGMER